VRNDAFAIGDALRTDLISDTGTEDLLGQPAPDPEQALERGAVDPGVRHGIFRNARQPIRPREVKATVFGSGTSEATTKPSPVPQLAADPIETVFVSMVTAPFRARALPQSIVAPVFSVILVSARIFPANLVSVPRVAELPT
jgi:hypothetical protein